MAEAWKHHHTGHRQRLKAEFLARGLEGWPDHKVLELLLCYAIPQGDVNGLAHELVERFGSLAGALDASVEELKKVPDLTLYGPQHRLGVIAFNLGKHHAYDVGSFLDNYGIAVRTGHHCAMPLMAFYQVPAMCRASLAMYNTMEEVDRLVAGLQRIHKLLG